VSGSNRKVYILSATANFDVVSGRWRGYCRDAFLTQEEAEAEKPAFLDRCAVPTHAVNPDPGTLTARVVPLHFEDDLDAEDGQVFMLSAEGRETRFDMGGVIHFVCGTAFATRERAEAEMPAFLDRCADPSLGDNYSERRNLVGKVGALTLRAGPEAAPDAGAPTP
jgi:hypothetical protein